MPVQRPAERAKEANTWLVRAPIKPGETRTVSFPVGTEALQFYNRDMKRVVEPGAFKIMVGPNSVDLSSVSLQVR